MSRPLRSGALHGLIAAFLTASLLAPAVAAAQSANINGIHYNLAAGASIPTSSFGDFYNTGYNILVGVGMQQPASPLGFRAEGFYNEFGQQGGGSNASAGGVNLNAVYNLVTPSRTQSFTVYAIGGVGYYNTKEPFVNFDTQSQNNIGFNIGGGLMFPLSGFSAYVEARWHTVSNTDVRFVPITFGLMF